MENGAVKCSPLNVVPPQTLISSFFIKKDLVSAIYGCKVIMEDGKYRIRPRNGLELDTSVKIYLDTTTFNSAVPAYSEIRRLVREHSLHPDDFEVVPRQ